jgi:hypothetical protein
MRSESLGSRQEARTDGLPLTVATVYLGLAALATLLALLVYQPVAFLPLVLLSFPFGFLLVEIVDTSSLVLQSLFFAAGIAINAWLAAMAAAAVTAAGRHLRR